MYNCHCPEVSGNARTCHVTSHDLKCAMVRVWIVIGSRSPSMSDAFGHQCSNLMVA